MRIAIISDTHLPKGNRRLPPACVQRLTEAGAIVHAGDLSTLAVLRELESYGPPVTAVHGNVDDGDVRAALPQAATLTVDDTRIAVIHDGGPRTGRLARLRKRFPDADAVIFGHSHIPLHETDPESGFQILNPGSPTERRRAPQHTMAVAHAHGGRLTFELIALD